MNIPTRLNNIITAPITLINSIDQGLRRGTPATQSKAAMTGENTIDKELTDLTDRRRINRTIENSREAMQIDPTTWSSIITLAMASNNWEGPDDGIKCDDGVSDAALEHIINKCKIANWDLDSLMTETLVKGMVDSKCFIRLWPNPEDQKTLDVDMLAYDDKDYNFLEVVDPETGALLGYKQQAMVYPIPSDWDSDNVSFDDLASIEGEQKEAAFPPEAVIHPKYLELDGEGTSLVYKVLDYVDIKREIENGLPKSVKRAMLTLGIEVQSDGTDLGIDTPEKAQKATSDAADNFTEREEKDVIAHMHGIKPYMIGSSQFPDLSWLLNYLKQEIRQSLFTPDSKFESASSNRAVAAEQMTGAYGLPIIINYNHGWIRRYIEHQLFTRELITAGFESSVGMIHLHFPDPDLEDDLQLAQIASTLEVLYPAVSDADRKLRLNTYFKPYTIAAGKQGVDISNPDFVPGGRGGGVLETGNGVLQNSMPYAGIVNRSRELLRKEGLIS